MQPSKTEKIKKILSQPLTIEELRTVFPSNGPNRTRGIYMDAPLININDCNKNFSISYNYEKCINELVSNSNMYAHSFILLDSALTQNGITVNDKFHAYTASYDTFLHYEKTPGENVFGANRIYAYLYESDSSMKERKIFSAKTDYRTDDDEQLTGQPEKIFVDIVSYASILEERCTSNKISKKRCDIPTVLINHIENRRDKLNDFSFALYISCEAYCLGLELSDDILLFLDKTNEGVPKSISLSKIETLYQDCITAIELLFKV